MLDSSICREWPFMNRPSAGTWSPIVRNTTSPTTTSKMELLTADTATTRKTATIMLPPSYQPSAAPCSLIPNPRERTAQPSRMRMVVSLKASSMKKTNPFGGGLWVSLKSFGEALQPSEAMKIAQVSLLHHLCEF
ncbi:hypothetical protein NMG60_11014051 [Bertholletia excelsa]